MASHEAGEEAVPRHREGQALSSGRGARTVVQSF